MKKVPMLLWALLLCVCLAACDEPTTTTQSTEPTASSTEPTTVPSEPGSTGATQAPHVHAFGQWEVKTEASCTSLGEEMRVCDCGESESREIAKRSHAFGDWVVQEEPTCVVNGSKTRSCECGETQNATIKANGHAFVETGREEPTPEHPDRLVHYACENCDYTMTRQERIEGSLGLAYTLVTDVETLVPSCYIAGIGTCKDAAITIPEYIDGYKVLGIAEHAFYGNYGITRIILPNDLFKIGAYAFCECRNLKTVKMPSTLIIIEDSAFGACSSLSTIDLPDGLVFIGYNAFYNSGLTKVVIPESVQQIDACAFYMCHNLKQVEIKATNCSVGDSIFYFCSSLQEIILPDGWKSINRYTFYGCRSLESVTIPVSVEFIGDYAFANCQKLQSIHYAGTIEQWDAIEMGERWEYGTNSYTTYCSDGPIKK